MCANRFDPFSNINQNTPAHHRIREDALSKRPNSNRNPYDLGQVGIWDLGGGGSTFIVNCNKRVAQKLCRIVLLHFGLVTIRFHCRKLGKVFIFMIFGVLDVSMSSKTNYSWLWKQQIFASVSRKSPNQFEHILSNLRILKIVYLENIANTRADHLGDSSYKFLKIFRMGSISIYWWTWVGHFVFSIKRTWIF